MRIISAQEDYKRLVILVCMHGNEHFGAKVFEYFADKIDQYPGLKVIFANEEAANMDLRFISQDLNRSFPGCIEGNHEQRLAQKILEEVDGYAFLVDVHTTTSNIRMTPMVASLGKEARFLINATDSTEVVLVPNAERSSIGIMPGALLLEFNEKFANYDKAAFESIVAVVNQVINNKSLRKSINRYIYTIDGKIPQSFQMPNDAKDFMFVKDLGYPFLLYERHYKDCHGLLSRQRYNLFI